MENEINQTIPETDISQNQDDWSPKSNWKRIRPYLTDMLVAAFIATLLFKVIFNISIVSGSSMVPTFHNGDILILSHISYNIERGDVIVFKNEERGNLVKRVIGVPGDTIEIKESTVYRNGEALNEDYINSGYFGSGDLTGPVTVREGTYFVMGDNRPDSYDSRMNGVGLVDKDKVIGEYLIRVFPFG